MGGSTHAKESFLCVFASFAESLPTNHHRHNYQSQVLRKPESPLSKSDFRKRL